MNHLEYDLKEKSLYNKLLVAIFIIMGIVTLGIYAISSLKEINKPLPCECVK